MMHGEDGLQKALRITQGASPGSQTFLDPEILEALSQEMPCYEVARGELIGSKSATSMAKSGLLPSKSEAPVIKNGGVYLNNRKSKMKLVLYKMKI